MMAEVQVIDSQTRKAGDVSIESLEQASDIRIASAFVTDSALRRILDPLERALTRGASVTVMYGLDGHITEPEVIERLLELQRNYSRVSQYVHLGWKNVVNQKFHTKLYIAKSEVEVRVLLGSSNLTRAGLWEHIEANVFLQGSPTDNALLGALKSSIAFRRVGHSPPRRKR